MTPSGDFSIGSAVWPGTSKLIEEMGELQQVLGKLIGSRGQAQHFDGSNLRERLVEEIADVEAALQFFQKVNLSDSERERIAARCRQKVALFEKWQRGEP